MHRRHVLAAVLLLGSVTLLAFAGPEAAKVPPMPYDPKIAPASDEGERALKRIRIPEGLHISLFAAEPMLANPVCFCFDNKGRIYVAETFRLHDGVTDIRGHMDWLDDDLASRSVEDRVTMLKKYLQAKFDTYAVHSERIRLIEDTTGSGKADRATVFADGFNRHADGIGAGLLAWRGDVWYTCIPDLWRLRDTTGAGKADVRKSLHTGYGVHVGFLGHDLHGLRMGPDGKLYFSTGDRGLHVQTEGRTVDSLDSGAVLRCNPDGSELEIVATGLRNPQELAFDQYGNLFTGDNNADGGDKARWVYVVEGGDSGWRIGYQFMRQPVGLGSWNAEKLWLPRFEGQAAYLVPPIANVADGPAGLTYYPGVGLPERYQGHFFLCDFRGGAGQSGIRSFAVKPRGASFEFVDEHQCIWSVLATDVEFGPDCALYLTDWVDGWNKPNKGRIYKVQDPEQARDPVVQSVKKLLAEGMDKRPVAELTGLLSHADMRVRQEAQFTLADKGKAGIEPLAKVAAASDHPLARLHAIWGLGQIGRKAPEAYKPVLGLVGDRDPEVRAQAARVLGDGRVALSYDKLLAMLQDQEPRVRFFAALAVGKLGRKEAFGPIVQMLRDNADRDAYLRHAGVMALTWIKDQDALLRTAKDEAPAVRMAVLLTLRRLGNPEVAQFLHDSDLRLVAEAARAINDAPIPSELPKLAALLDGSAGSEQWLSQVLQARSRSEIGEQVTTEPILYRALNANFRLGKPENAVAVAAFAARADAPEALRLEALRELAEWSKPSGRDRLVGLWRPLEPRPAAVAADAVRPVLPGIFRGPNGVRREAARLAAQLGIKEVGPVLLEMIADKTRPAAVRVETLKALTALKDPRLEEAMKLALADSDAHLRAEGRRAQAVLHPAEALPALASVLDRGDMSERQGAVTTLAEMKQAEADAILGRWLDRLLAGKAPIEMQLELLEAAAQRGTPELKAKLAQFEAARPRNDHLAAYREALAGGDADEGRKVFFFKSATSCLRCHKVQGIGGEVGPDLSKIGAQQKREYLLESIVDPNKQIAKGFEMVDLVMKNGKTYSGIVKEDTAKQLKLITPEGKFITVAKDQIDEKTTGKSAMPADVMKSLSKTELRDLVEFLASLK